MNTPSQPNSDPGQVAGRLTQPVRPPHGGYPDYTPPSKRRPWVLMSVGEVVQGDCDAIDRLVNFGAELVNFGADVVVVQDHAFERAVEILKRARDTPWPNSSISGETAVISTDPNRE